MKRMPYNLMIAVAMLCPGITMVAKAQETGVVSLVSLSEEADVSYDEARERMIGSFLNQALGATLTNIGSAKVALVKSKSSTLKAFASQVLQDHREMVLKINELAARNHVVLVQRTQADDELNAEISKESTATFDSKFVMKMVADMEYHVEMFRRAGECDDRWIRFFAIDSLPLLEHHLASLKTIQEGKD